MKIKEIMTSQARCVSPDSTLVEAAGVMRQLNVGAVPVCDHDHLEGIVTDRDLALRAISEGRDPNRSIVREVMTPGVVYAFEDQDVEDGVRLMEQHQIRRVPVLDRSNRMVGIFSLGDVALRASRSLSAEALKEVSESPEATTRS